MFDDATIGGEMKDKGVFRVQNLLKIQMKFLKALPLRLQIKMERKLKESPMKMESLISILSPVVIL